MCFMFTISIAPKNSILALHFAYFQLAYACMDYCTNCHSCMVVAFLPHMTHHRWHPYMAEAFGQPPGIEHEYHQLLKECDISLYGEDDMGGA